jgi:hypothetical protein
MDAFAVQVSQPNAGWSRMADYCSRDGAQLLKDRIEAYWRERGMAVTIALANVGFHPAIRAARYEIRSDMINGFPRGLKAGAQGMSDTEAVGADENLDSDLD